MSRWLIPLLAAPAIATAETPAAPPDMSDQAIGAELGVASGNHITAGGLRIAGHYLYQLSAADWFDGTAGFTFGGGGAACFRDRSDAFVCDHGLADGDALELEAAVRHFFTGQGKLWPYLRGGVGLRYTRFADDDVSGASIELHLGGGIRASLSKGIAVTVQGALELGLGDFSHSLGGQGQLGIAVTAGVEFRL